MSHATALTAEEFIALVGRLRQMGVRHFQFRGCSATMVGEVHAAAQAEAPHKPTPQELDALDEEILYHSS